MHSGLENRILEENIENTRRDTGFSKFEEAKMPPSSAFFLLEILWAVAATASSSAAVRRLLVFKH